jgi:hypothetical protein
MIERLQKETGLQKTVTFGSLESAHDIDVSQNDGRKVVRTLEKVYEPYFWATSGSPQGNFAVNH